MEKTETRKRTAKISGDFASVEVVSYNTEGEPLIAVMVYDRDGELAGLVVVIADEAHPGTLVPVEVPKGSARK